jgi:2-polyprenyl-6-methoxyphenol hydroxylase-like FAD-dependent oxidoreductase
MSAFPREVDVLIAGAGPTGLTLAAELMRQGVKTGIVDRQAVGANTSRAAVVHARTLEVLEPLGVTQEIIQQGITVPTFRVRDRDRTLITIDFRGIPSAYPFTLMCPQNRTEGILLRRLEALGGNVVRPGEFIRSDWDGTHINAEISANGATSTVKARWLVGCDGMHSVVREQAGIPFAGSAYEESFVLADVHMDWPLSREEVSLFFSPDGLVVVAPLPEERFRIVATADAAPESPSAEYVQSLLNERGPLSATGRIRDVVWSSRFRVHHRVSESPRKGRVLLCGDAAHVHSPAGGQGMNTGIQDSVSLANVLVKTLKDGKEARLDIWAAERHQVATGVVSLTDRLTRMATLESSVGRALRNAGMMIAGRLPPVRAAIARKLAELDTRSA